MSAAADAANGHGPADGPGHAVPADALEEYVAKYSNWGRWGADDERGTTNLISRAIVRDAARAVELGQVVGLGLRFDADGPQTGYLGRFNCMRYSTLTGSEHAAGEQRLLGKPLPRGVGYADDTVVLPLQSATHWDALSHVFHEGLMYNDRRAASVTAAGAPACDAVALRETLVGRAVLLDFPRAQGVDWLPDGHAIDRDQLDAAVEFAGTEVREGDIVLLRTGMLARCRVEGWGMFAGGDAPGLSFFALPWLAERGIAAVASDTWGVEVRPNELPDSFQPFHIPAVVYMGLLLGEMFDLESLAEACAETGRREVFFSAPPLAVTGSAGAPPGPVAVL
jgi:kynurenine formamidase